MKKILTLLAFTLVVATGKAQEKVDSKTVVQLVKMTDKVVNLDTIATTPLIVADSMLNYYVTFQNIEFKADKMMLLMWNKEGERIRVWFDSNELPELTVNSKNETKLMLIKKKKIEVAPVPIKVK